jgi:GntR family transcriptional regulator
MNATDVMLPEPATVHSGSTVNDNTPDAPPVPSFDYARVVEALAGSAVGCAGPPHMLTLAAQLAVTLRAQIGAGELVPNRPIPSESTLMQHYGVTRETASKAVRALVAAGLVYVVEGSGAYVAERGRPLPARPGAWAS